MLYFNQKVLIPRYKNIIFVILLVATGLGISDLESLAKTSSQNNHGSPTNLAKDIYVSKIDTNRIRQTVGKNQIRTNSARSSTKTLRMTIPSPQKKTGYLPSLGCTKNSVVEMSVVN